MGDLMRWLGEQFFQLIGLVGELFNLLCSWWTNLFGAVIGSFLVAVCIIFGRKIFLWREKTREVQEYKKKEIIFLEQDFESLAKNFFCQLQEKIGNLYEEEDSSLNLFVGVCLGKFWSRVNENNLLCVYHCSNSLRRLRDEISQYQREGVNEVLDHAGFSSVISSADAFEHAFVRFGKAQKIWDIIGEIPTAEGLLEEFRMAVAKFLSYITDEELKSQGLANLGDNPLESATQTGGENEPENNVPVLEVGESFDLESHPGLSGWAEKNFEKSKQDIARWVTDRDGFKK